MTIQTAQCVIEIESECRSSLYYTLFQRETDTLPDGSVENYWEVYTYKLDANGNLDELVNNTGLIESHTQALYEYALHLDLYHNKTLEEVIK